MQLLGLENSLDMFMNIFIRTFCKIHNMAYNTDETLQKTDKT